MADGNSGAGGVSSAPTPAQGPSASDPTTAGAAATSNSGSGYTAATTVSSVGELREKAPKLWHAMLQGIAMHICSSMQHHQARLKKLMRSYRDK